MRGRRRIECGRTVRSSATRSKKYGYDTGIR